MSRSTVIVNAREVFQLDGPQGDEHTTIALIEDQGGSFATLSIADEGPGGAVVMTPFLALELADKLRAWAEARAKQRRGGN